MKKHLVLLLVVWILTLVGAYELGIRVQSDRETTSNKQQIECLKLMWGSPLTLEQLERIRQYKDDPEAVRAYFLAILKQEGWWDESGLMKISRHAGPNGMFKVEELNRERPRAAMLLPMWIPGQTDIRATPRPASMKDTSPLWEIYLTKPDEAWARGVNDFGEGGR